MRRSSHIFLLNLILILVLGSFIKLPVSLSSKTESISTNVLVDGFQASLHKEHSIPFKHENGLETSVIEFEEETESDVSSKETKNQKKFFSGLQIAYQEIASLQSTVFCSGYSFNEDRAKILGTPLYVRFGAFLI